MRAKPSDRCQKTRIAHRPINAAQLSRQESQATITKHIFGKSAVEVPVGSVVKVGPSWAGVCDGSAYPEGVRVTDAPSSECGKSAETERVLSAFTRACCLVVDVVGSFNPLCEPSHKKIGNVT